MNFMWGVSSSSAQIEGAHVTDGKSFSVWDLRSKRGDIANNETCFESVNSYCKYKEDIKLIKELGCKAYRFSISWCRICPDSSMKVNEKGLEYYHKVVDECIKNGIKPIICLYHWDAPAWLYESDMWLSGEILKYFPTYCEIVVSNFCKKVDTFVVLNEPACIASDSGGNLLRSEDDYSIKEKLQIVHNILLAHGMGSHIVKKYNCKILTAINPTSFMPKYKTKRNIGAAKKAFYSCFKNHPYVLSMWLDPIVFGKYPDEYYSCYDKEDLPIIKDGDMKIIQCKPDYIGLNIYFGNYVLYDEKDSFKILPQKGRKTQMNWPVTPTCAYYSPKFTFERYNIPIIITENGCAFEKEDEKLRVSFLKNHIKQLLKAKKDGVDVQGYMYWSFIDNFEWFKGYTPKFGLLDKNRNKKKSYCVYQNIINRN